MGTRGLQQPGSGRTTAIAIQRRLAVGSARDETSERDRRFDRLSGRSIGFSRDLRLRNLPGPNLYQAVLCDFSFLGEHIVTTPAL